MMIPFLLCLVAAIVNWIAFSYFHSWVSFVLMLSATFVAGGVYGVGTQPKERKTVSSTHKGVELLACPYCQNLNITLEWNSCGPLSEEDSDCLWWGECEYCGSRGPL